MLMKNLLKAFLTGVLLTASVQVRASVLDDIKGFFSKKEAAEPAKKSDATEPSPVKKEKKIPDYDFSEKTIGDSSAPVKVIVFTSLTCPHCSHLHLQIIPKLRERYIDNGKAELILIDFPLEARAMTASLIARCLRGEAYFAFIDTLFKHQKQWSVAPNLQEALAPHAKLAGLSEKEMIACATDRAGTREMTRIRNMYAARYNLRATPTVIVRLGKKTKELVGVPDFKDLAAAIEQISAPDYN